MVFRRQSRMREAEGCWIKKRVWSNQSRVDNIYVFMERVLSMALTLCRPPARIQNTVLSTVLTRNLMPTLCWAEWRLRYKLSICETVSSFEVELCSGFTLKLSSLDPAKCNSKENQTLKFHSFGRPIKTSIYFKCVQCWIPYFIREDVFWLPNLCDECHWVMALNNAKKSVFAEH